MIKLIKFELERAFKSAYFLTAVLAGCAITVFDFFQRTYPVLWLNEMPKMDYPLSVYSEYIGLRATSLGHTLIFLLAPLLGSLPHADSLSSDLRDGYIKNIAARCDKRKWLASKYLAVFLSGMAVYVIPFLANLFVTALYVPAAAPLASTGTFAAARASNPFSWPFLSHPMIYIMIYLVIGCVITGLFCEIALISSVFIKSRFSVLLSPFICYMLAYIFGNLSGSFSYDPYHVILPAQTVPTSPAALIILPAALFLMTFPPLMIIGGKQDVL